MVGVLILAIFYAYFQYPRQSRFSGVTKAESPVSRQAVRRKARTGEGDQFRIRFDWLKNGKPFSGAKQDLFGPLFVSRKPTPLVSAKKTSSLPMVPKTAKTTKIYTSPLEFLGSLTSGKKKTYFFSQGENLFVAKKGQNFGKQKEFRIAVVTSKEIKIKKQGETEFLKISLVAKAPLSGFNKQRPQKAFLPHKNTSIPKFSDEMNVAPMEQQAPEELPSNGGKEQPPVENIIPEGDWEK